MLKILFFGDIVGRAGRQKVVKYVSKLDKDDYFIIANVENSAGGFGITKKVYDTLIKANINVLTGGNHIWDKTQVVSEPEYFSKLAVPANLPKADKHNQVLHIDYTYKDITIPFSIINLAGSVFMQDGTNDPFATFDEIYDKECKGRVVIVDFHAEATSEKGAFAHYVSGRAQAVIGTHTHVQTADEQMIGDTFFITDAGSCCAVHSVLGMAVEGSIGRFVDNGCSKLKVEQSDPIKIEGVELELSLSTMKIESFKRFKIIDF